MESGNIFGIMMIRITGVCAARIHAPVSTRESRQDRIQRHMQIMAVLLLIVIHGAGITMSRSITGNVYEKGSMLFTGLFSENSKRGTKDTGKRVHCQRYHRISKRP